MPELLLIRRLRRDDGQPGAETRLRPVQLVVELVVQSAASRQGLATSPHRSGF
jgi:hypothetical protein